MTYGESFISAVCDYLTANHLTSLGQLNRAILGDLAQRHHDHWQAANKPAKAPKPRKQPPDALSDADWLKTLSESPANEGVDVQAEFKRAQFWISQHPGRRFTRRFFVKFLLNTDRILPSNGANGHKPASGNPLYSVPTWDWPRVVALKWPRADFPDRDPWEEGRWLDVPVTVRQEVLRAANSA